MRQSKVRTNLNIIFFDQNCCTFAVFSHGCVAITGESSSEPITYDGISLDPDTLCAVGEDLAPLGCTKMSVKALRAELAVRQCPLRGNKKELIKQLQKARAEAEVAGASYDVKGPRVKKVEIIVSEESWGSGNLVARNSYEDERDSEAADDDEENEDRPEADEEEDEEVRFRQAFPLFII